MCCELGRAGKVVEDAHSVRVPPWPCLGINLDRSIGLNDQAGMCLSNGIPRPRSETHPPPFQPPVSMVIS